MIFETLNTKGCRGKLNKILKKLNQHKFDIVTLTETKNKGIGSEITGSYVHLYSGVPKKQYAKRGVFILIKRKLKKQITDWETINEDMIRVNINILQHRITILEVYAISNNATVAEKDQFFDTLNREIRQIGNNREIVILNDMNRKIGKTEKKKIIGLFGEETINDNDERLNSDTTNRYWWTPPVSYQLRITNGYFKHKDIYKYTCTQQSRNLRSIIDYAIVKQQISLKIEYVRMLRGIMRYFRS